MKNAISTLALVATLAAPAWAQTDPLEAEIAAIDTQITEAEKTIARYDGGLIKVLAETRREALLLARTLVENRQSAEAGGATVEITVTAMQPNEALTNKLLGEMASAQQRVEEAEQEAAKSGGLIQAVALSRVQTEKLTLAQLQMAYLQAKYGIAFPVMGTPAPNGHTAKADASDDNATTNSSDEDMDTAKPDWADPRYPAIDYTLPLFATVAGSGDQISGWWGIEQERAVVDDSPKVTAINYSLVDTSAYGDSNMLLARCFEGETAFIFVQDDYLITDYRSNSFKMTLRIDDQPAKKNRWTSLSNNKGAGLFGEKAEQFIREIYDVERLFVRLQDKDGQNHDANFDISGGQDAFEAVAQACGFSTFYLSRDDYRAIQTMLNAGGFNTGTPDGQWGGNSRSAISKFQASVGIPETGEPDRATLEKLGFGD